jgi:hypothetical protein
MKRHALPQTRQSSFWACLAACAALAGVGCEGSDPRDLGSSSAPITLNAPFRSDIEEFQGRWVGSAVDILEVDGGQPVYQFPSGSTQILLEVVSADGSAPHGGPLEGFIRFGSGQPLPPPTDPDSGYPEGLSYDALLAYGEDDLGAFVDDTSLPPFEGVDYSIGTRGELVGEVSGATTAADGVISFTFGRNQPLDAWCQLQTPHANDAFPSGYSCLPNTGGQLEVASPGTDEMCGLYGPIDTSACTDPSNPDPLSCLDVGEPVTYVNCDKVFLCNTNDYCTCTEEGCSATYTGSRLTVRRVGDELVGVFQNAVFVNERNLRVPLGEVRLQRVLED